MPEESASKSEFGKLRTRYAKVRTDVKDTIQTSLHSGSKPNQISALRKGAFLATEKKQIELDESEKKRREVEEISLIDPLTGLLNLRGYEIRKKEEMERAVRHNQPLVVAALDLNYLKNINDTEGHAKGDEYIKKATEILKESTRLEDIIARVGGDELSAILTDTDLDQANVWLERIRKRFTEREVSISIGMSPVDLTADIQRAIELADQRMYQDKRAQKEVSKNGK